MAGSPILLMALGIVLTFLCQSSTVVGAIAVAATGAGIFDLPSACWLIYGSNVGSGLNHIVLARALRGDAAQIALIQVVQKFSGFLGILAIKGVELAIGQDLLYTEAAYLSPHTSGQVAIIFLLYQLIGSLLCSLFLDQIIAVLENVSSPSPLQELSKPMYLIEEALVEPTFAIELAGREERRLLERLPAVLDEVRADAQLGVAPGKVMREAAAIITRAMSVYMEQILSSNLDREDRERIVRLQHRVANLNSMFESLDEFVETAQDARKTPSSGRVADQMVESLHSLLTALVDASATGEPDDLQFLLSLLGHRDEIMEKIRRRVMQEDPNMPLDSQTALFSATMLFERIIWLSRRNALLLTGAPATSPAVQAEAAQ
jgi:phosphate:Na+ symporter